MLIISARSLNSKQVTSEVVVAHESGKAFVPILCGMTHADFQHRQAEWRMALAAASTILIPLEGAGSVVPRITAGLRRMGVAPDGAASSGRAAAAVDKKTERSSAIAAEAGEARHGALKRFSRRTIAVVFVSLAILLSVGVLVYTAVTSRREPPTIVETEPPNKAQESPPLGPASAPSNVSDSTRPQVSGAANSDRLASNRRRHAPNREEAR